MEKQPEEITICELEVLVMPNGEIICKGKTLDWFDNLREYLKVKTNDAQA